MAQAGLGFVRAGEFQKGLALQGEYFILPRVAAITGLGGRLQTEWVAAFTGIRSKVRYELKTPYSDGTTHVLFEPLDFIARLVSLVPKPRVNLTRFHGVFAPHSKYRAVVTPAKRGQGKKGKAAQQQPDHLLAVSDRGTVGPFSPQAWELA